jgi:hypothetical protein
MRSRLGRVALSMSVLGTVAAMGAASVAFGSNPPARMAVLPPVIVSATPVIAHKAEPHPEIQMAIRSLERAKEHLEHAAHDYRGHRVDAIAAIDAALNQLRVCMRFDR